MFSFTEVEAAAPGPEKPEEMRFQELPIYEQPFADYQDYQNCLMTSRCSNVRPIYDKLLPNVRNTRIQIQNEVACLRMQFGYEILNECICDLKTRIGQFRSFLTAPENIKVRQGIVTSLILAGFFGSRQNRVLKKLFFASVGGLFGGCLCFPTETDKLIRQLTYTAITNLRIYRTKTST